MLLVLWLCTESLHSVGPASLRFDGYHVRFRGIARGGMRLVTPATSEQFALESGNQYDECYGLAYAQQLKNKDIPEVRPVDSNHI